MRSRRAGAAAVAAGLSFALVVATAPLGHVGMLVLDNGGQLAAATLAAAACARAASRTERRRRRAWWWLAAGTGSWAAGQAVWTWYELVAGREVPFPSLADVGFLAFPLASAGGLLAWLYADRTARHRVRDLLDGVLVAGSLLLVSWVTTLSVVHAAGATSRLALVLALAYPVGDVVLATLVLFTVSRSPAAQQGTLWLLAAGLGSLSVADSAYVYLTTAGDYSTGNAISAGWVTGFLFIAAAARSAPVAPAVPLQRGQGDVEGQPSWLRLALPYVPLVIAALTVLGTVQQGRHPSFAETAAAMALLAVVLLRQFLVLADNYALVERLRQRELQLAHQAYHDPLTGLANRALFMERVDQLVAWHARDGRGGVIVFCDLDDFKIVNDTLGHPAGDAFLVQVAARLRSSVRATDTVARLGGDEFAVLAEAPHDPAEGIAERIAQSLGVPVALGADLVPCTASVGAAVLPTREPGRVDGSRLLAAADRAMYEAKSGGKGRHMVAEAPLAAEH